MRRTLLEFISFGDKEELKGKLLRLDSNLEAIHSNNFCILDFSPQNIVLYDDKMYPQSFKRMDYLSNPVRRDYDKRNILELCAIGIMAYNNFRDYLITSELIKYIKDNLKTFNQAGDIPSDLFEYYLSVFEGGDITYFNDYLSKKMEGASQGKGNAIRLVKSTAIGKAFSERENEAAFVNWLMTLVLLTSIIIIGGLIYFLIKYNNL